MRDLTVFPLPAGTYWKTSPFGWRTHPVTGVRSFHRGQDYGAPTGTLVFAPFDGYVTTGWQAGGAGNWTNVQAGGDVFKSFHHSQVIVHSGFVTAGTLLAKIGTTGSSTGPHAHIELWENGNVIDPTPYLDAAPHKGSAPAPAPTPEEDEDVSVIAWSAEAAYLCNGLLKRNVNLDEIRAAKFIGVKDIGRNDAFLALLTEIPRTKIAGV